MPTTQYISRSGAKRSSCKAENSAKQKISSATADAQASVNWLRQYKPPRLVEPAREFHTPVFSFLFLHTIVCYNARAQDVIN
jgi:hypothetical protein